MILKGRDHTPWHTMIDQLCEWCAIECTAGTSIYISILIISFKYGQNKAIPVYGVVSG